MVTAASLIFSSVTSRHIMSLNELKEVHTKEDERENCILRLFRQLRSLLNNESKSSVIISPFLGFRVFCSTFLLHHLFQVVIQGKCVSFSAGDTDFAENIFSLGTAV